MPRQSPPSVGAEAPRAAEPTAPDRNVAVGSHGECSHAHRCSSLMGKRRSESSGLVTLTFDLLTLKVVSESRVTWATSVSIFVFLGLSVLDLHDRQTSDSIIA